MENNINKKVMLIDDSEVDNFLNEKILKKSGFCDFFFVHTSGKSAIEFLRNIERLPEYRSLLPEYMFLDINMPIMSGFQFIEEYAKLSLKVKDFSKIVILTSSDNNEDRSNMKKYPFVLNYLNKPLTPEKLGELS